MNPMKAALLARAQERAQVWKPIIVKEFPDHKLLTERTVLGSYCWALQKSKIRLLNQECLIPLGEGMKDTPAKVARDYLLLSYGRGPKITHEQAVTIEKNLKPVPLYAKPGSFEHGFYIDIESTYWTIQNIAGWDVDYYPGKWLSPGRPPQDFPFPRHKQSRSCLVSVARPGWGVAYEPEGRFPPFKSSTPVINLSISKLISDVLNSIAQDAIKAGAVYVNNDGYIAPSEKIAASICRLVIDWGLNPRIKAEGEGRVKSAGAYKVGREVSIPYTMRSQDAPERKIFSPRYKAWLLPRFAKLASAKH